MLYGADDRYVVFVLGGFAVAIVIVIVIAMYCCSMFIVWLCIWDIE